MDELYGGTLSIDVGATGTKGMVLNPAGEPVNERVRLLTPRPAKPRALLKTIAEIAVQQPDFERVSIGFPGVVVDGVVMTAPNLDGKWKRVPLAEEVGRITGKPTRVANDADVQGRGIIRGKGVEMVLTLGTGTGSAVFVNGRLVPNLELGHHPLRKGATYETYVGDAARKKVGNKAWNKRLRDVIGQILPIWNPSVLYLGGGNAKRITGKLPKRVERADNLAGILGGIKLWL